MIIPCLLKRKDILAYRCYLRKKSLKEQYKFLQEQHKASKKVKQLLDLETCKLDSLLGKRVRWSDKMITLWHECTFPNATVGSQLLKLKEEIMEAYKNFDDISELADVYIVAVVLRDRYKIDAGDDVLHNIIKSSKKKDIFSAVDEKMAINLRRDFKFVNGVYHH